LRSPGPQLDLLRQRMAAIDRKYAAAPAAPAPAAKPRIEEWISGAEVQTEAGVHFECTRLWGRHQRHGGMHLSELEEWPADLLHAISDGAIRQAAPHRIAFLDTETTGLAGGTGTYPFLVGVGGITERGFEVRQFFMRDYGEEPSQLLALREFLAPFDVLVTYNGRAYDQPLLETRYRLARLQPPFGHLEHLDLLYGARRLWKLGFESCRLVELETQILGYEREGDVPGAMIPYLYFEYLRTRHAGRLAGIFEHNALDIVTLACLTGIVPRAFADPLAAPLRRGTEMVGLARWLQRAERFDDAAVLFGRAIQAGLPGDLLWRTMWDRALLEKRQGREAAATAIFTELSMIRNPHQSGAYEELAKFFEHKEKNYSMALDMTDAALQLGRTPALVKRRERLAKKEAPSRRLL